MKKIERKMICGCLAGLIGKIGLLLVISTVIGLAAVPTFAVQPEPDGFSAKGTLIVSNYLSTGDSFVCRYHFTVTVSNGLWRIDSVDDSLDSVDGSAVYRHIIAGTDHDDVYMTVQLTNEAPSGFAKSARKPPAIPLPTKTKLKPMKPNDWNRSQAYVTSGSHPGFDNNLRVAWFALLSSRHLDEAGVSDILPFWFTNERERTNYYTLEVTRETELPRLPSSATFSSPNYRFVKGGVITNIGGSQKEIAAEYHVQQWTNLGTLKIPLTFDLVRFGFFGDKSVKIAWHGEVLEVAAVVPEIFLPEGSTGMPVTDYRFKYQRKNIDSLHYEFPVDGWLKQSNAVLQGLFK